MTPFEILFVAHLVGDVLFGQTEYEAINKATRWRPCITHAAKWTLIIAAASIIAGWRGEVLFAASLFVMGVLHAIIDRRWPVVRLLRLVKGITDDPPDWLVIWTDQVLHIVQIAILASRLQQL